MPSSDPLTRPRFVPVRAVDRPVVVLTAFAYASLVLLMWVPFSVYSGLPSETGFVYTSETSSVLEGFLYRFDPLRIHTKTFYHLSYLIGEALGIGGSYVPFQVVHASLWWARGILVFLILRTLVPDCLTFAYVAGALVIVHSSDGATQWIGQLNQFGFIFWLLLACYLLATACQAATTATAVLLTTAACFAEYMSLWSYESQILLLLVFPLVLALHRAWRSRRFAAISAAWYVVAAVYVWLTLLRYMPAGSGPYQETVLRVNWRPADLLLDWSYNVVASLAFWRWADGGWQGPAPGAAFLSLLAAMMFAAGGAAVSRLSRENQRRSGLVASANTWLPLLVVGFVVLLLSFPVYLVLATARSLWRTQLLSGIGSGVLLATLLGSAVSSVPFMSRRVRFQCFLALAAVIVWFGSDSAITKGAFQRSLWERHRAVMRRILQSAPSVKPNTVIVLVDVARDDDPFGHNMWLDLAVRLVYPGIPVAGTYFFADGTPSPGGNLHVEGDHWKWDGTGFAPLVWSTGIANTVIVNQNPTADDGLVKTMPAFLCGVDCAATLYNPTTVIAGTISPRAVRRYRLSSLFGI